MTSSYYLFSPKFTSLLVWSSTLCLMSYFHSDVMKFHVFLHDLQCTWPWIKVIFNELDFTFHMTWLFTWPNHSCSDASNLRFFTDFPRTKSHLIPTFAADFKIQIYQKYAHVWSNLLQNSFLERSQSNWTFFKFRKKLPQHEYWYMLLAKRIRQMTYGINLLTNMRTLQGICGNITEMKDYSRSSGPMIKIKYFPRK